MSNIVWLDKQTFETKPEIPADQKVTAGDMNQIKQAVNSKADQTSLDAALSDIAVLDTSVSSILSFIEGIDETYYKKTETILLPASSINSGQFANARIAVGSVTQHQSALNISASQIFDINPVPDTRSIIAGDGLSGGGPLSANITLSLAASGVSPGTYATPGNIQVDAYGRIVSLDNSNSGGGGGTTQGISFVQIINGNGSTSEFVYTHNQATQEYIAEVYNISTNSKVLADVVPNVDDDPSNKIRVIFQEAPTSGENFRLVVLFTGSASGLGGGASGETNTASNQGSGVGVFNTKTGVDLEFRSLVPASNKISIALDAVNKEIDIDVVEANLSITESQISDLGSYAASSHSHTLADITDSSSLLSKIAETVVESTTTRTLTSTDNGKIIFCTNAGGCTITVPTELPNGFQCSFVRDTSGTVALAGAVGVTINADGGLSLTNQNSQAYLIHKSSEAYYLAGNLS